MKKMLFLLLFPLCVYGEVFSSIETNPFPKDETGNISFVFVVESDFDSSALLKNAKTWIATTAISTKSRTYTPNISMDDTATGRIIVEYTDNSFMGKRYGSESMAVASSFIITFDCKDKKYRYKIENYVDVLKYGNKEYIKTFGTLHDDYENNNDRAFVIEMKEFFVDISDSIQKLMSVDDDF